MTTQTDKQAIADLKARYNQAHYAYLKAWHDMYQGYADHPLVQPKPTMKTVHRDAAWTDEQLRNAIPHDLALECRFHASALVIALDYSLKDAMTFKLSDGHIDPRKGGEA